MTGRKKVLITGAAGRIGRTLRNAFVGVYDLRLLYHSKVLPKEGDDEVVVGDLCDFDAMVEAVKGVDVVVHMAGIPGERAFEQLWTVNIQGTYHIFEAARQCGVNQIVFASTNHVTGFYEKDGVYVTPEMPVRPDSLYGVSKAFGEALGRYYVDQYGMSVHCLRIGSFVPENRPRSVRALSTWMSHPDMARLVQRCIEAEDVKFGIFYGISDNTRKYWDIANARELVGYDPEDDAETYAGEIEA